MTRPPALNRGSKGDLKILASFNSGRYWFTLSASAKHLFDETLEYTNGDEVSFHLFKTLVVTGDAYLPSHSNPVDVANDLATPDQTFSPDAQAVHALTKLVSGNAYSADQIERLEELKPSLERGGGRFSLDGVEKKTDRVEDLRDIAEDL